MSDQAPSVPELQARVDQLEELVIALASYFTSTRGPAHPDAELRRQEMRIEELGRKLFEGRRTRNG